MDKKNIKMIKPKNWHSLSFAVCKSHGIEPIKPQKSTAEPFYNTLGHIFYNLKQNGFILCGFLQTMSARSKFYMGLVGQRKSVLV